MREEVLGQCCQTQLLEYFCAMSGFSAKFKIDEGVTIFLKDTVLLNFF